MYSGVESRINCLEQHGCSRIRTKAEPEGFACTVTASVVATNLCQIRYQVVVAGPQAIPACRMKARLKLNTVEIHLAAAADVQPVDTIESPQHPDTPHQLQ